jgi:hypothetical protein
LNTIVFGAVGIKWNLWQLGYLPTTMTPAAATSVPPQEVMIAMRMVAVIPNF